MTYLDVRPGIFNFADHLPKSAFSTVAPKISMLELLDLRFLLVLEEELNAI